MKHNNGIFILNFNLYIFIIIFFFFQAEDGIRDLVRSRGLGDVYKRQEYHSGKEKVFGFFVGQVMKESKGKANPKLVNDILKKMLSS